MLIKWEDLEVGDEIIIPSNSNLKYLKVTRLGVKSHACSFQKGVEETKTVIWGGGSYNVNKPQTCEPDISKHNATFYLK